MNIVDVKRHHERDGVGRVYGWQTVAVHEAMRMADPRIRCPECKGPVGLYNASLNGKMAKRAEHRPANPGCSLGDEFNGEVRFSSFAIEPDQGSYRMG